ncbi:hypothetical protein K431DRAFT_226488 [Polychaeton citri CBS 116435]|uniref:Copper transport protein n=1 Tax=Polychaeton citri CBS 116435 TaxID=1314669 RepID=A0A9P4Q9E5_9PEZI|nr:hypothetical protein K431DRAFT_226488 [Polychaeton citri CBS 116435]
MAMVFFTSTTTPLFSWSWVPRGVGQYAGTCIFLIALATIFRGLVAVRLHFHDVLAAIRSRRLGDVGFVPVTTEKPFHRPWRANEAVMLATMDVILAGISYLLMLAVMTMNVGYFLSVLGGVFLGSLAFAQLSGNSTGH